jgi:hypothetical protein
MQSILIFAVLLFAANAFAQDAPQVGNKPVQVKPKGPGSCKPLGKVEGTKLWAGDCVGGPLDARAQRRNEARRPLDARSPEEEKTW